MNLAVSFTDVESAYAIVSQAAHRTPVFTSATLDSEAGAQIFLKCENFQRMGAFKFRGAWNALTLLSEAEKERGVIAYSSGNHAQGVALAAKLLGIRATIVMPNNAPAAKVAATKEYGADVVIYDVQTQDRAQVAADLAAQYGSTVIPPYDHPHIIAGQGTAAYELIQEVPDLDAVVACVGGGGLLAGTVTAVRGLLPQAAVYGVEPEVANDAYLSFRTGTLHTIHNPPTIADGTRTPSLGSLTFPIIKALVTDIVTVSEVEIKAAVRFAFYRLKLVIEPSGALGLAAVLFQRLPQHKRVGIVISGGNVDGATMASILTEPA
jgi:threonine dehydratase